MKHSTNDDPWWLRLADGTLPLDALGAGLYAAIAAAIVLVTDAVPLRVVVALPFLLFVPGYCLLLVLYPGRTEATGLVAPDGLTDVERVALSFGASLVLLPLLALGLWAVAGGYDTAGVVTAVALTTIGLAVAGSVRRRRLPADRRYAPPVREWAGRLYAATTAGGVEGAVNIALTVAVALAVVSALYVAAVPTDATTDTGFRVLTDAGDGEYVAGGYPEELVVGEPSQLVVAIENHEDRDLRYTVVVELQRVGIADGDVTVQEANELSRLEATVADGETTHLEHAVEPTMTGEGLRLQYHLYRGDAPADPDTESAYRTLSLWVDVGSPSQQSLRAR